jgi:hypothetical protein
VSHDAEATASDTVNTDDRRGAEMAVKAIARSFVSSDRQWTCGMSA